MYEITEREPTREENNIIRQTARRHEEYLRRFLPRTAIVSYGVSAVLGLLVGLLSDAPKVYAVLFAVGLGTLLTGWIYLSERRQLRMTQRSFQGASEPATARVHHVQSNRVVEFEEYEDEGACYAFEIDEGRLLFITGQEFYESETFPNSDFSIIEIEGPTGMPLHSYVDVRGKKLTPSRVIPAKVKWDLTTPEHMEIIEGTVETAEESLRNKGEG